MSLVGFLILGLVTIVVGSIGQMIGGYSRGGCLASWVVGFLGAYLGVAIARQFDLPMFFVLTVDGQPFPLVWAIIGSVLVAGVLALMYRGRGYRTVR